MLIKITGLRALNRLLDILTLMPSLGPEMYTEAATSARDNIRHAFREILASLTVSASDKMISLSAAQTLAESIGELDFATKHLDKTHIVKLAIERLHQRHAALLGDNAHLVYGHDDDETHLQAAT